MYRTFLQKYTGTLSRCVPAPLHPWIQRANRASTVYIIVTTVRIRKKTKKNPPDTQAFQGLSKSTPFQLVKKILVQRTGS